MQLPEVVSAPEWRAARERLLAKEKQATRARDALAAERRRLPRLLVEKPYVFEGPAGRASLLDLFDGRRQLLVYHFMWRRMGDPSQRCEGCSMVADHIGELAHLHARDTTLVLVSRDVPTAEIESYKQRMGWDLPWFSALGPDFDRDHDVTSFGLNVFLRDGGSIYRTYFTSGRGVEALGSSWSFLDLTPFGRQETWEDSPAGYPQTPPYEWWRLHDEYDEAELRSPVLDERRP